MDVTLDTAIKVATIIGSVFAAGAALRRYTYMPILRRIRMIYGKLEEVSELTSSMAVMGKETECLPHILHDIRNIRTTQIRIEQRQVIEAQIQQCVLDSDSKAYFHASQLGELDMVSTAFCKLVGRTESELLGNNWLNCVDYRTRGEVVQQLRLARTENRIFKYQVDFVTTDGKAVRTIMNTYPIPRNVPVIDVMLYFGILEKVA